MNESDYLYFRADGIMANRAGSKRAAPQPIDKMSDRRILAMRIRDCMPGDPGDSLLTRWQKVLRRDLDAAGLIHFQPDLFFADEWFCPEGSVSIAMPFYLAHPRLRRLQRDTMLQVEGGRSDQCLKLLRHEAGHAFEHAYRLSQRRDWQKIFGNPGLPYRTRNRKTHWYSRRYVHNLGEGYGQTHPFEDFAETFALCVRPGRKDWIKPYRQRPVALGKIEFVTDLIVQLGSKPPLVNDRYKCSQARNLTRTLSRHYRNCIAREGRDHPSWHDGFLRRHFSTTTSQTPTGWSATDPGPVIRAVTRATGAPAYRVRAILSLIRKRSRQKNLSPRDPGDRFQKALVRYLCGVLADRPHLSR